MKRSSHACKNCWPTAGRRRGISMRRASWIGTSRFMSASRTFCATRAPASPCTPWPMHAPGGWLARQDPAVAHAARWSPKASKCRRHVQARGARGKGKRSLRSRRARNGVGNHPRRWSEGWSPRDAVSGGARAACQSGTAQRRAEIYADDAGLPQLTVGCRKASLAGHATCSRSWSTGNVSHQEAQWSHEY